MNILGLVWNCRGLKKKGVATYLKDLIGQNYFHFIGLQETMIKECDEKILKRFDPNKDFLWLYNSSKGKSGGILVGVRVEFYDVGSFQQGDFMLQLNLWDKQNKIKWNLLIVYGATHEENKMEFLAELSSFCSRNNEPIIIGGDFNILRYAYERNKPHGLSRFSGLFNSLIGFYELREIVMTRGLYTWSNNQEDPTLEKLDRILVSKDWEEIFPTAMVKRLPRGVSDHNPLILSSGMLKPQKFIQFKFELNWLEYPDFLSAVEKIWTKPCRAKSSIDRIQQKLKLFKQYFKGWGFNLQGELRKKRNQISEQLAELEDLEDSDSLTHNQVLKKWS